MTRQSTSILVLDDDPYVCEYLRDLLERFGYEVEFVQSYRGALTCLQRKSFDGLLLDVWIGEERADRILEWLREQDLAIPVVMMSAMGDYDLWIDLVNRGAADLIAKPIQPHQLQRTMKLAFLDHALPTRPRAQSQTQ